MMTKIALLLLASAFIGASAIQPARAQLRPEVRDRTIAAAVQIALEVTATDGIDSRTFPLPVGSGTVVSPDGLILTNWHVVDMVANRRDIGKLRELALAEGYDVDFSLNEERVLILVSNGSDPPQQKYTATVAANSVLDPTRQSLTIPTDLGGMLSSDPDALDAARQALQTQLARYPDGCRAGFVLISGKAPSIDQGIQVARQTEALLRQVRGDIFTDSTGFEHFALPNEQPSGEVSIDIFFYSGCAPIG